MSQRTASTLAAGLLALLTACATPPPAGSAGGGPAAREGPPALPAPRSPFAEPPGVFWAEIKQSNIETTICVSGWTATVRPSVSFTQGVKRRMLEQAGVDPSEAIK